MVDCLYSVVPPKLVEDWKKNLSTKHCWNEIIQCCLERTFLSDPEHNKKCVLLIILLNYLQLIISYQRIHAKILEMATVIANAAIPDVKQIIDEEQEDSELIE